MDRPRKIGWYWLEENEERKLVYVSKSQLGKGLIGQVFANSGERLVYVEKTIVIRDSLGEWTGPVNADVD